MLRNAGGGGVSSFLKKKRYVILEWPPKSINNMGRVAVISSPSRYNSNEQYCSAVINTH